MQRRLFLQTVASWGIASASSYAMGQASRPESRIKVGQIGTRHAHALGQLQTLLALPDLYELVGVVEPDQSRREQLAAQPQYQRVKWLEQDQLFNTAGLQVVAVETEVNELLATAQQCVDAGLHIHLDKPAGESLPLLEKLHETAEERSLLIQMGYMFRYNPAFQFLSQAVAAGWLGEVFEVHGVMSKKVDAVTRQELARYRGGSMFELGCHLVDPLLHLLGRPRNVIPFNRTTSPEQDSLLDNTLAVFEFEKATATIRSSLIEVDGGRRRQFVVCGSQGTIAIRPLEPPRLTLTLDRDQGEYRAGTQEVTLPATEGRYHGAWRDVASAVRDGRPLAWSHEHDLAVQRSILIASGYPVNE